MANTTDRTDNTAKTDKIDKTDPANNLGNTDKTDNTGVKSTKKSRAIRIIITVILAILVIGIAAFAFYVNNYYHADDRATNALQSTANVKVHTLDNGDITFGPADPQAGIVFYPGGKVQAEAYAPLMQDLAERGFLSVIVPMPFNLAVFNTNGANGIQEQFPTVHKWILMGHSLGGSMAASYVDEHSDSWDGLILLASYSTADLTDNNINVLCIRGSNDNVLNMQAYTDNRLNLTDDTQEFIIPGGNHAQFGDYGNQSGDGEPEISTQEQQALTADVITQAFL